MNTTVNDQPRHPTFTENVSRGLNRAQEISGSSSTMPIVEVRNSTPRMQGSKSLNDFLRINMDIIVTEGTLSPYGSQRATLFASAGRWGFWGTSLVDFQEVDAATAGKAFMLDQIIMDEEEAHTILQTTGFMGPWESIFLCKLPASGLIFYVFQQPREEVGRPPTNYQLVAVEDGSVRILHGVVQHPCSQLRLDLTMNITFQAEPAKRTDFQASPNGSTNVTSQKDFEVEGVLSENVTAS